MVSSAKHSETDNKKGKHPSKSKSNLTEKEIFSTVQKTIAHQLKKTNTQITLESKLLTDLGADSLDAMEIVLQLEDDFHVRITEEEAAKMASVRDIVNYVLKNQIKSK